MEVPETTTECVAWSVPAVSHLVATAQASEADSVRSVQAAVDDKTLSARTPWLNRTKWQDRFAGKDMTALVKLGEKPDPSEAWMLDVWRDAGSLIRFGESGLRGTPPACGGTGGSGGFEVAARRVCGRGIPPTAGGLIM